MSPFSLLHRFGWDAGEEDDAILKWRAYRNGCVGHGNELEGERPLWGLRQATTSQRQLHEPRGRVGRKPETN